MDDESLRFWSIPFVCFIVIIVIFSFTIDYKVNTVFPNAELERQALKNMKCPELLIKDSFNDYWTRENGKIGHDILVGCKISEKTESSGLSPYVEFCIPGGFAPIKKIDNSTHSFNHDTCLWNVK